MKILKRLKKIDRFVLNSFLGPYFLSFFIAQFVLIMQFLWKYIDDILGKGFTVLDLLELIFYFAVMQIPMALPIAILLSSVMVFGNMSEKYELSSMKSAGISLLRIMRSGIVLALITAFISILASNVLKPQANFQMQKRLRAMKAQKPSLTIEPRIFNRDFTGFSIRVAEKNDQTGDIDDVLIYDHTSSDKSLVNLTKAKQGRMYNSEDGNLFIMELEDGTSYRESKRERKKDGKGKKYPFMRTEFKSWKKVFDMSEFDTDEGGMNFSSKKEDMLNAIQLLEAIDSVDQKNDELILSVVNEEEYMELKKLDSKRERKEEERVNALPPKKKIPIKAKDKKVSKHKSILKEALSRNIKMPSTMLNKQLNKRLHQKQMDDLSVYSHWYETIHEDDRNSMPIKAVQTSSRKKDVLRNVNANMKTLASKRNMYQLRLHQQFSFALICIVFLFIGSSLGSIIRKGGYGYPLLYAILFYMLFVLTTIMGEKLIRDNPINPIFAAWLANLLVLPIAFVLTFKALRDSRFEGFKWFGGFGRLIKKFRKQPA